MSHFINHNKNNKPINNKSNKDKFKQIFLNIISLTFLLFIFYKFIFGFTIPGLFGFIISFGFSYLISNFVLDRFKFSNSFFCRRRRLQKFIMFNVLFIVGVYIFDSLI